MSNLNKLIAKELHALADKFDADTSEISEAEAIDIVDMLMHRAISKATACNYLGIRRSKFDSLVQEGKLPKGRKRVGFKEKVWWKDELINLKNKK